MFHQTISLLHQLYLKQKYDFARRIFWRCVFGEFVRKRPRGGGRQCQIWLGKRLDWVKTLFFSFQKKAFKHIFFVLVFRQKLLSWAKKVAFNVQALFWHHSFFLPTFWRSKKTFWQSKKTFCWWMKKNKIFSIDFKYSKTPKI